MTRTIFLALDSLWAHPPNKKNKNFGPTICSMYHVDIYKRNILYNVLYIMGQMAILDTVAISLHNFNHERKIYGKFKRRNKTH